MKKSLLIFGLLLILVSSISIAQINLQKVKENIGILFPILEVSEGYDNEDKTQRDTKINRHIYGHSHLAEVTSSEITYFFHDRIRSTRFTTDSEGWKDREFKSLPFGQELMNENIRYSFATDKELDKSGFYYFGARYYDPNLGRFTSVDPVNENEPYSYVDSNPTNLVDPTGKVPRDIYLNKDVIDGTRQIDNFLADAEGEISPLTIGSSEVGYKLYQGNKPTLSVSWFSTLYKIDSGPILVRNDMKEAIDSLNIALTVSIMGWNKRIGIAELSDNLKIKKTSSGKYTSFDIMEGSFLIDINSFGESFGGVDVSMDNLAIFQSRADKSKYVLSLFREKTGDGFSETYLSVIDITNSLDEYSAVGIQYDFVMDGSGQFVGYNYQESNEGYAGILNIQVPNDVRADMMKYMNREGMPFRTMPEEDLFLDGDK